MNEGVSFRRSTSGTLPTQPFAARPPNLPLHNTQRHDLPDDLVFSVNYLGGDQSSFTLNFSRGASQIVGQYYNFLRLCVSCLCECVFVCSFVE